MNAVLREHHVQWVTAAPLWRHAVGAGRNDPTETEAAALRRPALIRFDSDSFMDDLQKLLASAPESLKDHEATKATRVGFRERPPDAPAGWSARPSELKLYQPVHGHFNLVGASLVCRRAGLPDHAIARGADESVGFVIRRLDAKGHELAWTGKTWAAVAAAKQRTLARDEEVLPLFPVGLTEAEGRRRTLFFGFVPTASGASFDAAATGAKGLSLAPAAADAKDLPDPRQIELKQRVIDPLEALYASSQGDATTRAARQDAVRFLLLDTVDFLARYLPTTWTAIRNRQVNATTMQTRLEQSSLASGWSWADALRAAHANAAQILAHGATTPTIDLATLAAATAKSEAGKIAGYFALALKSAEGAATKPPQATADAPGPESAHVPKLDPSGRALYVLRCVYRRPQCGPLHGPLVSDPSERFQIAPFFDPDAPARPIQITLPVDTSDLRSFNKNVRMLMSEQLQQAVNRASKLSSLTSGSLDPPGDVSVGLVCSFSIPIITICALILLMIVVNLLNIVFWWLPFFRICFPALKART